LAGKPDATKLLAIISIPFPVIVACSLARNRQILAL
jgi:hypothetical protein